MRFIGSLLRLMVISIILLLPACAPQKEGSQGISTSTPNMVSASQESVPQSGNPTGNQSSPTGTSPNGSTTAQTETAIPPEGDWREAPIMPEVSQKVLQIYRDGQAQGRDPNSFSVIGDCQSIPYVFLGPFERGELAPDDAESYLWNALNHFKVSLKRWSVTSRGGFTAASILNPLQADPHYCKPGETPLTCEYRLNNPAFVFITLETWLDLNTVDRYESYLRQIMDYVIAHGTVPILITKADAGDVLNGKYVIDPAIVRVARDYDVPVVNFWRAAQYLSNGGIDPTREGFHLSQDGYNLKNILALRALYSVWQAVDQEANESTGTTFPTPTQQAPSSSQSVPQFSVPDCKGGCVFFATAASLDGEVTPQGIYAYSYVDKKLIPVLDEEFDLQDVSDDGQRLLVNKANNLFEINLASASSTLISDSFFSLGKQDAYWNSNDSQPIFIDQDHPFQTDAGKAFNLFPSPRDEERYFEIGTCSSKDYCQSNGTYSTDADQSTTFLDGFIQPVFSPDGKSVAYLNPAAATKDNYYHISYLLLEDPDLGIGSRRVFYFPDESGFMVYPDVRQVAFSPDSSMLFIIYDVYSAYFENSLRMKTYLLDFKSGILYDYGMLKGISGSLDPHLVWSPDGDNILFFITDVTPDNQYSLSIFQSRLSTGEKLTPYDSGIMTSKDYFYITNIYWR